MIRYMPRLSVFTSSGLLFGCFLLSMFFVGKIGYFGIVHAASPATVFFQPASQTAAVGKTVTLQVSLRAPIAINSIDITLGFPIDKLVGLEANINGTIFPISVFPPNIDVLAGTAHFVMAIPSPGYKGFNGLIGTVSFRAQGSGEAKVTILDAKVIANDGKATNVYGAYEAGIINDRA